MLQKIGNISDSEMLRVFNCGIGMLLVVPPEQADEILERTPALGERIYRIGEIEAREPEEASLLLSPPSTSPS
jgi:phosphoribosylformylglycinamidine cyclo-ligase